MILHPGHLNRRAEFYRQLGQMIESGLPILQALEVLKRHSLASELRNGVSILLKRLPDGSTLANAVDTAGPRCFPAFDAALMRAGEASGRLPECLAKLSLYYEERARMLRQILMWTVYPMIIVHMILLIFPIELLQGLVLRFEVVPFLLQKLLVLVPFYTFLIVLAFLMQGHRAGWIRGLIERVLWALPLVGKACRSMAMGRLCLALESLLASGTSIVEAWELAGPASGSSILTAACERIRDGVARGKTPAEIVLESPEYPLEFAQQYYSAELSGKLDVTLGRLQKIFEEQGLRQSRVALMAVVGLIYGGALVGGAVMVIRFWMNYFGQIQSVIQ